MLELKKLKANNVELASKEQESINGGFLAGIGARLVGGAIGGGIAERLGFGGRVSNGTVDYARQRGLVK
ncbi:MAG: hypothetical protein RIQ33_1439 [Bacteroidota bacterium]|jgi:hypothetical protein